VLFVSRLEGRSLQGEAQASVRKPHFQIGAAAGWLAAIEGQMRGSQGLAKRRKESTVGRYCLEQYCSSNVECKVR